MPLTYGRDSAAPTLLLLSKVLLAIRKGSFKPDCTRSGRFVGARSSECIEIKDEDESPRDSRGREALAQLNLPVGLSVVSMLALWSGLHLLSLLRWVMVSPMQGLPALAAVRILGAE